MEDFSRPLEHPDVSTLLLPSALKISLQVSPSIGVSVTESTGLQYTGRYTAAEELHLSCLSFVYHNLLIYILAEREFLKESKFASI